MARSTLRYTVCAAILVFSLAGASTARAEDPSTSDDVERLAGEGLAKILQALDLLMKTIPQYAAPEVLPNGDIIIRRLQPEDQPDRDEPSPSPEDGTET